MQHSQHLYHTVLTQISDHCATERVTRQRNLALIVTALYLAASCQLTRLADRLHVAGTRDSRVQRVRRFLMNERVMIRECYQATARAILSRLSTQRIVLIFDRTMIEDHLNVLTLCVAYRGRALPLAWKVLKKPGQYQRCHLEALLRWVARQMPAAARSVWVVGDREFQAIALQTMIETELGWNYVQRVTHNLWLYPARGAAFQPSQLGLRPGQQRVCRHVRVTRQQAGPAHFLAYWAKGEDEPWYLLSNRPVGRETLHVYNRRSWIEPMYRDFKSYGWCLEASRITNPKRFAHLLLALALAYVWLIQLASQVVHRGWRRFVDRTRKRTLSYFRIGWNWLLRLLDRAQQIALPNSLYV